MDCRSFVAALMFIALTFSAAVKVAAAEEPQQGLRLTALKVVPPATPAVPAGTPGRALERPAPLPALYVTLGAMQAWDVYSTRAALKAGAHEANPTAAPFAGHAGSLIALKAATTAGTIFFAERMWKKNRVGAIVTLVALNGATAAVAMHNRRVARAAAGQTR